MRSSLVNPIVSSIILSIWVFVVLLLAALLVIFLRLVVVLLRIGAGHIRQIVLVLNGRNYVLLRPMEKGIVFSYSLSGRCNRQTRTTTTGSRVKKVLPSAVAIRSQATAIRRRPVDRVHRGRAPLARPCRHDRLFGHVYLRSEKTMPYVIDDYANVCLPTKGAIQSYVPMGPASPFVPLSPRGPSWPGMPSVPGRPGSPRSPLLPGSP